MPRNFRYYKSRNKNRRNYKENNRSRRKNNNYNKNSKRRYKRNNYKSEGPRKRYKNKRHSKRHRRRYTNWKMIYERIKGDIGKEKLEEIIKKITFSEDKWTWRQYRFLVKEIDKINKEKRREQEDNQKKQ